RRSLLGGDGPRPRGDHGAAVRNARCRRLPLRLYRAQRPRRLALGRDLRLRLFAGSAARGIPRTRILAVHVERWPRLLARRRSYVRFLRLLAPCQCRGRLDWVVQRWRGRITLRRSGNLWMPIGFHLAFDWGETY